MTNESKKYPLRVAKYIAQSGIASRRQAEKMIYDKRVEVNGDIIESPALNINKSSIVKVDGEEIFKQKQRNDNNRYYKNKYCFKIWF